MDYLQSFGIEAGKEKYHEEVFYGVILIYNLLYNEISTHLKDFDLSPAQFNALLVIQKQSGDKGISQVEISKKLIVTPSNTTRLLDKLEEEKLIERSGQVGDRRVNLIKMTAKGSKLLDQLWPVYQKKIHEITAFLNTNEQKTLSGLLLKWLNDLA